MKIEYGKVISRKMKNPLVFMRIIRICVIKKLKRGTIGKQMERFIWIVY